MVMMIFRALNNEKYQISVCTSENLLEQASPTISRFPVQYSGRSQSLYFLRHSVPLDLN